MLDTYPQEFDSIRPFTDAEIPAAMQRIADSEFLPQVAAFIFPGMPLDAVRSHLRKISNVADFQHNVMQQAVDQVVAKTTQGVTVSGLENIDPHQAYLFVSNHRDIVLDASFLQPVLDRNGFRTCQITFGANLMRNPLVVDVGKSNKMFKVERGGNPRQFYASMTQVSAYMRYAIEQRGESVWIAQRNGRTKDGRDATEASLIKMFARSGKGSDVANVASLNICPLAISYEWEPCDALKALELSRTVNGVYQKAPNEDLISIITGITQPKGRVHLSIAKPITAEDLQAYRESDGDLFKWVAEEMDRRIYAGYKLMPTNYIAHDMRSGTQTFASQYTDAEREAFVQRLAAYKKDPAFDAKAESIYLGIYANPVDVCR